MTSLSPSKSAKTAKSAYVCSDCGSSHSKWTGQCSDCQAWNTLQEFTPASVHGSRLSSFSTGYAGATDAVVRKLAEVPMIEIERHSTTIQELDRVLGGGLVPGSVILLGGDPGIGKSTLLLQCSCVLSEGMSVLYVTGEESLQQVSLRANRLSLGVGKNLSVLAETEVEKILQLADSFYRSTPSAIKILVIDSIQTMFTSLIQSAPGSVSQVRESAAQLVRFAKQTGTVLFLVGHVTKEGALAGPRVLEHMVDTVLYFEGQSDLRYRLIRAVKNRFGSVNEIGVFAMTDKGLKEVNNPSAIFLSASIKDSPGSVVMVSWEGTRPLLVEVQALVDSAYSGNPRRLCVGLDQSRLAMLLAVLSRHGGVMTHDQDVFVNVVGGVKILETGSDLAMIAAIVSSLRAKPIPRDTIFFGEVGLSGEIRPVQSGQERLKEAAKQGFKRAIIPKQNAPKQSVGMDIIPVSDLQEALLKMK
jgi:DNA repair protein RadA/Sms